MKSLNIKKLILVFLFLNHVLIGFAEDSIRTLNAEQLLQIVRKYHPIVRQAQIAIEKSSADILVSRSAFDPVFSSYSASKTFDNVNYYNDFRPELRIPTWYGIELSGGLENLTGDRLDPAQTAGKVNYVGISIPLAKNLIIDKRRAFLQQAKVFKAMATVEQRMVINDLSMMSLDAYWNWVRAYQTYLVVKMNVDVSKKRLDLVRKSFMNGERSAIDTVEALTQLQSFQFQLNYNQLEFQNAGLALSAFLWTERGEAYILPETVVPQDGWDNEATIAKFSLVLNDLLLAADNNHPNLQYYDYKIDALEIDKRLKFQELLPKVDFNYNQLGKGYDMAASASNWPLFNNNYQYGLKIEIPIRLSLGRGEYKKAKLKIEETQLDLNQKKLFIQLKLKTYYNEYANLKDQILLQSASYANYKQLVSAEETKFMNGESSLFLINTRENKALDALGKLIELKTKYYKSIYALQWSAGLLQF